MTKDWKYFVNDHEVDEETYKKIMADHEVWLKEEEKKKELLRQKQEAEEKKLSKKMKKK